MTEVTVFRDAAALGAALATEIADAIELAALAGQGYVLGCPGGRSPVATYQALARLVAARNLDLSRLVIAMMDDYVRPAGGPAFAPVPADAHYSVRNFASAWLAGPLSAAAGPARGVTADRVWFPDAADPARYDDRLAAAGGVDLFILASGTSDGHVAFNPPGTPAGARTRVVCLPESTRRDNLATFPDFASIDQVPRHGVTIGVATIAELSARAVLVAHGRDKQRAVKRLAAAASYDPDWPATVVAACRSGAIYADEAAASPLPPARSALAGRDPASQA